MSALVCGHVYHNICLDSYCMARQMQLHNLPCPICKRTAAQDVVSSPMPDIEPPDAEDFADDFDQTLVNFDSDGTTLERDSPTSEVDEDAEGDEDAVPPGQPSPKALAKAKGKAKAKAKGSAAPKADPSGKAKATAKGSAAPKADPSGKAMAKAKGKAAPKANPSAEPSASAKPKAKQNAKAKAKASAASAADSSAGDATVGPTAPAPPSAAPPSGELAVCAEGDVQCHQCRRWVGFQKVRLISKKAGLFRCSSCGATATQLRRKFGSWPTEQFAMLSEACSFRLRALLPQVQRSPALVCEHALPNFSGPPFSFPLPSDYAYYLVSCPSLIIIQDV